MHKLTCLFGGTFDPIHYGHLKPLVELQQHCSCEEVRIIPAAVPPHRPAPVASTADRLAMLRLALAEYPGFTLDSCELDRDGPSYSVLTLQALRASMPDAALCLVMGSDAFAGLPTWYHWQEIPELCHIIVIERPGEAAAGAQQWAQQRLVEDVQSLQTTTAGFVLPLRLTLLDTSATDIRQRLATGQDVKGMLPESVLDYIREQGLYRSSI